MTNKAGHKDEWTNELAKIAAEGIRDGTLTLKDVLGLTSSEIEATRRVAQRLERENDLRGALTLHATLASVDPYTPKHWKSLAQVHERLGSPAGSLICHEILALLQGRDPELVREQAKILESLGFKKQSRHLRALARAFSAKRENFSRSPRNIRG